MRLLVAGGRDFEDKLRLWQALDVWNSRTAVGIVCVIHGAARGADTLAGDWAKANGVSVDAYPVDAALDGPWPAAGPRRNARMLAASKPHLMLAFPRANGRIGTGTADMMLRARAAGLRVVEPLRR